MSTPVAATPPVQAAKAPPVLTVVRGGLLQRACACGNHAGTGGECAECRRKREGTLQRAAVHPGPVPTVPPIVHAVLRGSGQPLDGATRAFMEPRFGHDFSAVRVHTDAQAAQSAAAVNALAYTVGRAVVFGAGQFAPGTTAGRRLLAHELTHTVQQGGQPISDLQLGRAGDAAEAEAQWAADVVLLHRDYRVREAAPSGTLARQPTTGGDTVPASNGCRRTLSVPCPGSRDKAVDIPPPEGLGEIENLANDGACPLSIGGLDENGQVIMPNIVLNSGQSRAVFRPPPGTARTVVACFKECMGSGQLSYSYRCV